MKPNFFVVVSGPTGSGKTDIVNILGDYLKYPIAIINADMGQFYSPISIGTAKPDWKSEKYPQYLFDIINEPKNFTTFDYRQKVKELITELWSKDILPIIVGGSSFYISSLFYSQNISNNKNSIDIDFKNKSNKELWQELCSIDPIRAKKIHCNDRYRIERALSLWYKTKQLPSEQKPEFDPLGNFYMVFLTRDREDLYQRINKRVVAMIKEGWFSEVKNLNSLWCNFLYNKNLIGYKEIIKALDTLENKKDLTEVIEKIQKDTRNYAKRQVTFWRSFEKKLKENLKNYKNIYGQVAQLNLTNKDKIYVAKDLSLNIKKEISNINKL